MARLVATFAAIAVFLGGLALAEAAEAATPRQAAKATRACLIAKGWTAKLADGRRTVDAQAPRTLAAYPYRPWYSVSFFRVGTRLGTISIRMRLNPHERRQARACRNRGLAA